MGFFDMDEFSQAAEDSTIVPHPLAKKLSLEAKTSYLGMVIFSALVDDGKIDDKERKNFRNTGLSLSLPESDINETLEIVTGLKTNTEKMAFVKESIPALSDHDVSMFLYCDMVSAMVADGVLSADAKAFLSGMAKFLKISAKDLTFLNEYTEFFPDEKKPEAADVVYKYSSQKIPDGLVKYFTPVLNPVRIQGGNLPLGENKICDGHFVIDSKVVVGAGAKLLLKDAQIDFNVNGWIEIEDGDAEFIDSKLSAMEDKNEKKEESSYYFIHSNAAKLSITGCAFDGKMIRAAVSQENALIIKDCIFDKLNNPYEDRSDCVEANNIVCDHSTFSNCQAYVILYGKNLIKIYRSQFVHCTAANYITGSNDEESLYQNYVLYRECKASYRIDNGPYCGEHPHAVCYEDCVGCITSPIISFTEWEQGYKEEPSDDEKK